MSDCVEVTSDRETAMGSVDYTMWHTFDGQDVGLVSSSEQVLVVGLLGGLAILALHLLPILHSLGLIRPRQENYPKARVLTPPGALNVTMCHYIYVAPTQPNKTHATQPNSYATCLGVPTSLDNKNFEWLSLKVSKKGFGY